MDDVFVSYAREDRTRVQALVQALEARGISVWIDHSDIPVGAQFDDAIERALAAVRSVIVVWTQHSIGSRWVKSEASAALDRNCLVPVLLDAVAIPLEFRRVQTADLTQWKAGEPHEEFERLVQSLRAPGGGGTPPPAAPRPPQPSSSRSNWSRIAIAGAAFAAVAAWWLLRRPDAMPPAPPPATSAPALAATATGVPPAANAAPAVAATSAPTTGAEAPPPAAAIPIAIGDPIDAGVPVAGAGTIGAAYAQTTYAFDAAPRESAFFRARSFDSDLSYIRWKLTDSDGTELFNTCLGCTSPGVVELRQGGRYTLTVGGGDAATGQYSLRLTRVPPPETFPVALGDKAIKVAEDVPAKGAGTIEAPGARDLYTFSAPPKALAGVYIDKVGNDMSSLRLQLLDDDGEEVFGTCLGCTNPGPVQLLKGGTYTLSVGGNPDPATGIYALRIVSVPQPARFDLGALSGTVRIAPGKPGPGAGEIKSPGAMAVYTFTVPEHARVAVHIVESSPGMSGISLRITDGDGISVHDSCLGCSDPGALDLPLGGTYMVAVGSNSDPATGTYALDIGRLQ